MSVHLMSLVWKSNLGTVTRKMVMLRLADFSNDDGDNIFPSISRVAAECDLDRRTVEKTLAAFRAEGLLHVISAGGWDGKKNRTTQYKLQVEKLTGLPAPDRDPPGMEPGHPPGIKPGQSRRQTGESINRTVKEKPSKKQPRAAVGNSDSRKSSSTLPARNPKESPNLSLKEQFAAVDDPDASDEDRFWAAAGVLSKAGVPRSQMAKLAKLSDGFDECLATLRRVAEARNPATYLAKIIHNLKAEAVGVGVERPGEPEFVREFRLAGYEVMRDKDGKRWWCGGTTYDHEGCEC